MKLMSKAVLLVFSAFPAVVCGGCGAAQSEQPQQTELVQEVQQEKVVFTDSMQEDLSEQIKVNAQFVYPQSCKNGKGVQAVLGENLFWDRQDEISGILLQDRQITNEFANDYGAQKRKVYEAADGTILSIYNNNYLNYATDQSIYINNALYSDSRFDDYNGDKYLNKTDLDFMPQDEAWANVKAVLDKLGVEISDSVTCFVMEHSVMEEEEAAVIARAEAEDTKSPMKKEQWTDMDDCYYFKTRTSWEGYPVLPVIMGEGYDEDNVSVIYDRNGIQLLYINGYYPLEKKNVITIQSPEAAVWKLKEYLENVISSDLYEIQKITLCQKIMQMDADDHTAEIKPVWECSVLVKSGEPSDDGYIQKIYFDAETLKVAI